MTPAPLFLALTLMFAPAAQADELLDALLKKALDSRDKPAAAALSGALSEEEILRGLKEALVKGGEKAVAHLGREGGFLNNLEVRVPLPDDLKRVEKLLRKLKQDKYADQFVTTLNRAAEKAVPEAAGLLRETVQNMSVADARAILKGGDDAATRYFRQANEERLKERFLPIVREATDQAGVTAAYKKLLTKAGPAAALMGGQAQDLDGYVTGKALDGLFVMIAREEKAIRENPLERGTELLKKVFGAVARP